MYPLSAGGLWLAVTITPATAPRCLTAKASTGVGNGPGNMSASLPEPVTTIAVSAANSVEPLRAS